MQDNHYRIIWVEQRQGSAKILRIFGHTPVVNIPGEIEGFPVVELGDYCFSKMAHLPEKYIVTDWYSNGQGGGQYGAAVELCGGYVEQASLPDSLVKIGSYAFYNCRNLESLEFGGKLNSIGSDAFMNCYKLKKLRLRCNATGPSCLQKMLAQISWDVEAAFLGPHEQATLFYPEYYENYDEIAPAHIFQRRITGGGFRARQCFVDHRVDYSRYDDAFIREESNAEPLSAMCRLAVGRLHYPVCLSDEARMFYGDYIFSNSVEIAGGLVRQKALDTLEFLCREKLLSDEAARAAVVSAASSGWTEGSASMLRYQQPKAAQKVSDRYSFG